ncbi:hypothetical protein LPJ53_005835 [Coemansia erecta]|uniref:Peptidase S1 domain-containing protein n=1 Tax=Coemansia erecta TaxID=147472 RepID=A0A9W7XWM3_9FUNG|nr:hypothetical protein LPJ53_005835 [Coemansia erecta]
MRITAALALMGGLAGLAHGRVGLMSLNKRIVGGTAVAEGQNQYAVHLTIKSATTEYLCGGTLLDNNLVVTAAHCMVDADTNAIYEPSQVTVCYGSVSVAKMACTGARNITVNSQYNPETYINDIALIQITALTKNYATLPIYTGSLPEDTVLTTMGWGRTSDTSLTLPDNLQSVDIEVGDAGTCKKADGSYSSANGPEICSVNALTPGKDSCSGDSGSPTVISVDGVVYLAGLTSTGVDLQHPEEATCATADGIAFYTHVNYYIAFITGVTGQPASRYYAKGSGTSSGSEDDGDDDGSKSSAASPGLRAPSVGRLAATTGLAAVAVAAAAAAGF